MSEPLRFDKVVARPCSHLTLSPMPGTRFALYLNDKKQTRIRLEYQKGKERELAEYLMMWCDRHLMPFVPMAPKEMPTATELLDIDLTKDEGSTP